MKSSKKSTKTKIEKKLASHPKIEYPILVLLIVGAFIIRTVWQWGYVFVQGQVWYRGVDAWYHMRLVDNMMVNFPRVIEWDFYSIFPGGTEVGYLPLLSWIITIFGQIWNYEVVGALLPPIAGALTLIPVYFIGKEIFSGKVGLLACLIVAVLPGEFLHRSMLGFADHHVLETLLMATTLYLLIKSHKTLQWRYVIPAGISFGLYLLNWAGAVFFLLIVGIWMWMEFLRCYRKDEDIRHLVKVVTIPLLIGLFISLPFLSEIALIAIIAVGVAPAILFLITKYARNKDEVLFALMIIIPVGMALLDVYHPWRDLIFPIFWGGFTYIHEAQPLILAPNVMFATYGISFFLMFGGLFFCKRDKNTALFLVWCLILTIAVLGQRRWGYYAAIPAGLLTSYFIFRIAEWVQPHVRVMVIFVVCIFLFATITANSILLVRSPQMYMNTDWNEALTWVRENTPDPFEDPNAYYQISANQRASYSVLTWWDYGHWIIRVAHRVPLTSPTQSGPIPSKFFTSKTIEEAEEVIGDLNIKYIIIHRELLEGKWYALPRRAGVEYLEPEESILWQIWNGELPIYKPIYARGDIKIFERLERR